MAERFVSIMRLSSDLVLAVVALGAVVLEAVVAVAGNQRCLVERDT